MNIIEELIEELCPDGVKFRALGGICDIHTGTQLNKTAMFDSGKYLVLNGGVNQSGYYDKYNTNANTITISQGGASAGFVNFIKEPFWAGAHCFVIKPINKNILNKFIYYILKNKQNQLMNAKLGAGIPGLNRNELKTFKIPIPPLTIQKEIVKILDHFTELEAELEARKKQYEYYRDALLRFGDDVPVKALGEVARIKNGKDWKKLGEGDIPVYGSGDIMAYVDTFAYDKPTVLIPRKGSITNIFYVETPIWNVDTIYYTIIDTNRIIPKFFYYYMKTIDLMKLDTGSGRPSLTQTILNAIKIPIPPLSKQKEIVSILDKFDALVNDISVGLPAEITARKKQYEYYRNKLLTFKPLAV